MEQGGAGLGTGQPDEVSGRGDSYRQSAGGQGWSLGVDFA